MDIYGKEEGPASIVELNGEYFHVDASVPSLFTTSSNLITSVTEIAGFDGAVVGAGGVTYPGTTENGLGSIEFNNTDSHLIFDLDPVGDGNGPSSVDIFLVVNVTQSSSDAALFCNNGTITALSLTSGHGGAFSISSGSPTYYVNGDLQSWATRGDVWTSLQNQGTKVISIIGADLSTWENISFGATGGWQLNGGTRVLEAVVYDNASTSVNRTNIESILGDKWGVTGGGGSGSLTSLVLPPSYPDRAKRWFKSSVAYTDLAGTESSYGVNTLADVSGAGSSKNTNSTTNIKYASSLIEITTLEESANAYSTGAGITDFQTHMATESNPFTLEGWVSIVEGSVTYNAVHNPILQLSNYLALTLRPDTMALEVFYKEKDVAYVYVPVAGTASLNTPMYVAFSFDGSNLRVYIDGAKVVDAPIVSIHLVSSSTVIGCYRHRVTWESLRLSKVARYAGATMSVPTAVTSLDSNVITSFTNVGAFGSITPLPVPSHSIIHGVKVKPTVEWGGISALSDNALIVDSSTTKPALLTYLPPTDEVTYGNLGSSPTELTGEYTVYNPAQNYSTDMRFRFFCNSVNTFTFSLVKIEANEVVRCEVLDTGTSSSGWNTRNFIPAWGNGDPFESSIDHLALTVFDLRGNVVSGSGISFRSQGGVTEGVAFSGELALSVDNALSPYNLLVAPATDEYKLSTCFEAVPHAQGNTVDLLFTGNTSDLTQGELDIWLQLSRTL